MTEATTPGHGLAEAARALRRNQRRLLSRRLHVISQTLTLTPVAGLIGLALVWSQPTALAPLSDRLPAAAEELTRPLTSKRASIEIVPVRTQPTILAAAPAQSPTKTPQAVSPTTAPQPATPAAPSPPPAAALPSAQTLAGREECKALLARVQIEYEELAPIEAGACQAPAPIKVTRIGRERVELSPPAIINCRMAVSVAEWLDQIVQPAAREHFNQTVATLGGITSFACRNRNNAASGPISEHAFANAIDIGWFRLSSGRRLTVAADWGPVARDGGKLPVMPASAAGSAPARPGKPTGEADDEAAEFLRRIHAGACSFFSTVLGPEANDAHRDHFHFDLKSRERKSLCQ